MGSHVHLLEAALEGRVFFDVLAVLVERGGADHAQLATSEHRLDHVAGVHCALGCAGADDGVDLVDERDDLTGGVGDLLQHGLQPLLELTAVLRAGQHRADVETDQSLVLQALGYVAIGDAAGQAFHDGGLAHARLADEHRVVLGATRQHLDDPTDLVVAPDDRVDLAVAGALGEVLPVLLQRCEVLFRVLAGDPVAAAHFLERLQQLFAADAEASVHGQQQVLDGEEVVLQVVLVLLRVLHHVVELAVHARVLPAVGLGQLAHRFVGLVAHHQGGKTQLGQHRGHDGVVLPHERGQHVVGGELGVAECLCLVDGRGKGFVGLEGPLLRIERHVHSVSRRRKLATSRIKFSTSCVRRRRLSLG